MSAYKDYPKPFGFNREGVYTIWLRSQDDTAIGMDYYIEEAFPVGDDILLECIDAESYYEDNPIDWARDYYFLKDIQLLRRNSKEFTDERYGPWTDPNTRKTRKQIEEEKYEDSQKQLEAFRKHYGKNPDGTPVP